MGRNGRDMDNTTAAVWASPSLHAHCDSAKSLRNRTSQNNDVSPETQRTADVDVKMTADLPVATGPKVLPFEFKALEACLESACRCLESEVYGYFLVHKNHRSGIVLLYIFANELCPSQFDGIEK